MLLLVLKSDNRNTSLNDIMRVTVLLFTTRVLSASLLRLTVGADVGTIVGIIELMFTNRVSFVSLLRLAVGAKVGRIVGIEVLLVGRISVTFVIVTTINCHLLPAVETATCFLKASCAPGLL